MVRKLRFGLFLAAAFLLQATVLHRFSHRFLRPDLLLLTAAFLALEASPAGAIGGAFALGLLRDLGSCGRLGTSALILLPATGVLLLLRGHLMRESPWTDLALTFLYVLGVGMAGAVGVFVLSAGGELGALVPRAVGQAAFTTALSPLVFAALARLSIVEKSDAAFGLL